MIQHENCTNPRWFSTFFSYLVHSFLNLLCHELVLSTTHLLAGCFFRFDIFCVSVLASPLFLLYGKCGAYPLLMISCFTVLELYALSRHRCCSFLFLDKSRLVNDDDDDDDDDRLIIVLSITSVTSLMSWVLEDDMTAESGTPFVSVKICLFVPSLPLSVGLLPVIAPPKATLSICCLGIARST